jgi:hypothetical protein
MTMDISLYKGHSDYIIRKFTDIRYKEVYMLTIAFKANVRFLKLLLPLVPLLIQAIFDVPVVYYYVYLPMILRSE